LFLNAARHLRYQACACRLCCTKRHRDRVFSEYFEFGLSVLQPRSFIHSFINHSTIFPGCNVPGAVPRCTDSVRICYVPISDRKARSVRHSRLHTAALYKHYYNRAIYQEDKTPMFIFSYKLCRRGLTRRLKHFCARDRAGDCQDQPFSAVISV